VSVNEQTADMVGRFAAHVDYLLAEHGVIRLECASSENACALRDLGMIITPAVVDECTYVTAMHELGHCLASDGGHEETIKRERAAWAWAEANVLCWTPAMAADKLRVMGAHGGTRPDTDIRTYERQARLDGVRQQLATTAAVRPRPRGESIAAFMKRRGK